ncbi:MAG TPA: hypothetical protein VLT59_08630, partial [Steroidobacteraceae bacterium]|nr:hypothetical protein [Steroidobacteraceae bacterium]
MKHAIRVPAGLLALAWLVAMPPALAEATLCDRLAAHPFDPDRTTAGVERASIDFAAAEAACREEI